MSFWHDAGHIPGHWSLSGSLPSLPRAHVDSSLPQTTLSIKVSSARSHAVMSSTRRRVVQQSRQFCIRLGVRVDVAILGLQLEA